MKNNFWINNMHSSQRDVAGLIKSAAGTDVHLISSHRDYRESIFMTADEYVQEPSKSDALSGAQYGDWLLDVAHEKRVTGILAMRYAKELVARKEEFERVGIRIAGGATTGWKINFCEDKFAFYTLMKKEGVPMPDTYFASWGDKIEEACRKIEANGDVACVKPNVGVFGRGFWVFNKNAKEFDAFSGSSKASVDVSVYAKAHNSSNHLGVIVMKYLSGIETSVDCVCDNGEILVHAVRKKHKFAQLISTGGKEFELAQAVAKIVGLDGLVNIQFKEDDAGNLYVLEVNTRPSGGVGWSSAVGINLPYAAYCMMNGVKTEQKLLKEPVAISRVDLAVQLPQTTQKYRNGDL